MVVLALVLALGVLGFLLRMTQSQHTDGAQLAQMISLGQLDAELNAGVAQARLNLEVLPPAVAQSTQRLAQARRSLGWDEAAMDQLPAAVTEARQAYFTALRDKLAKADAFQVQRGAFVGDFQKLHQVSEEAQKGAAASKLAPLVLQLAEEVRAYCLQPAPVSGPRIVNLMAQIQSGSKQIADPARRATLLKLRDTSVAVLSAKDKVQLLSDQLLAAPTGRTLGTLRATYGEYHRAELASTARYRLILVVYTLALLVAFGLIGLRLRHSIGALDQANTELQNINLNLERTVYERTQDLRKALDDLREQQAQLIQSEKMASLGQMVAGVAHEINTPLGYATSNVGVVRESLEVIKDNPEFEDFTALLKDAEHGLTTIADLVMSLKNFSRVDRSRTELFTINDGLDTALKICHNQLKGRVEIERDYGELPPIPCAPSQLNQVFLNLLTNAGQAIEGDGRIRIRTRDAGDRIEIAIRDSGCGMDAETQSHIFKPFFTTKEVGEGTGLGLTIVFRIIEDHNGRITVQSAPGAGTEFTITLPKPRAAAVPVTAGRVAEPQRAAA